MFESYIERSLIYFKTLMAFLSERCLLCFLHIKTCLQIERKSETEFIATFFRESKEAAVLPLLVAIGLLM